MQASRNERIRVGILWMLALIVAAGLGLLIVSNQEHDPFEAAAIESPPFASLTYSVQAFLWWDTGVAGVHLDWVRLLAFNSVKQTFPWRDMETAPGVWDFTQADRIVDATEARNLNLVARLGQVPDWAHEGPAIVNNDEKHDSPPADLADWGNYCATLASRYRGRIHAYQIWNEPNLSREWGEQMPDAQGYTELLAVCSEAIRAADPDAILISAGLAPTGDHNERAQRDDLYLQAMYDAGFQRYIDVVGAHAPGFSVPEYGPDDAERDGQGRWATFRRVEDLRRIMIANGDAARQMAILEFGWTTDPVNPDYAWFAVSPEEQARYITEAYAYARDHWRPWVGLMSLIYLPDPSWTQADEEYWWSISLPESGPMPAFFALASMSKTCDDYIIPERPPDHPEFTGDANPSSCP